MTQTIEASRAGTQEVLGVDGRGHEAAGWRGWRRPLGRDALRRAAERLALDDVAGLVERMRSTPGVWVTVR